MLFYYCFEVSSVVPQSFTEPVGIAFYINQITVGRRTQDYIRQAALQATAKKLTSGQTVKQMQQDLQNGCVTRPVNEVFECSDKRARELMSLGYAEMVEDEQPRGKLAKTKNDN